MSTISRYGTHAVVLVTAVVISGYATVDHQLRSALPLGAVSAQGLSLRQDGGVGGVMMARQGAIITPIGIPLESVAPHRPLSYVVAQGDNMGAIAARYGLSPEQLRWSNPGLFTSGPLRAGLRLAIPPVPGVVVTVRTGDTLSDLARVYGVDAQAIADFNYLRNVILAPGSQLVLPGSDGLDISVTGALYYAGGLAAWGPDHFPYGQCTWYAASRRMVPWTGNAGEWFASAQAMGWPTGQTPRAGAIMVDWENSYYGHVAYVESVNPDGSWVVSEMNYKGLGVISSRTVKPGSVPLEGFIY